MNKNILELLEKSADDEGVTINLEKFAESIVKKCVSICENTEIPFDIEVWRDSTKKEMTALTAIALGNLIKEHFGVGDEAVAGL